MNRKYTFYYERCALKIGGNFPHRVHASDADKHEENMDTNDGLKNFAAEKFKASILVKRFAMRDALKRSFAKGSRLPSYPRATMMSESLGLESLR